MARSQAWTAKWDALTRKKRRRSDESDDEEDDSKGPVQLNLRGEKAKMVSGPSKAPKPGPDLLHTQLTLGGEKLEKDEKKTKKKGAGTKKTKTADHEAKYTQTNISTFFTN